MRKYEMPWRRAYEAYAAIGWTAGLFVYLLIGLRTSVAAGVPLSLAFVCLLMAAYRWRQAVHLLRVRGALGGRAIETLAYHDFLRHCRDETKVWLGYGFEWLPVHSQRLYELNKVDFRDLLVPRWVGWFLGREAVDQPDEEMGLPYLHGVEPREVSLYRPLTNFEGGTNIIGTTQSGKGTVLRILIPQAIRRGDVVIVIDPKNSDRLKSTVRLACQAAGRGDAYLEFHPAFPESGVRWDPLYNWQKATELASRIQAIMPTDTSGSFSAFGWSAVNVVVQGFVELEDRPNLAKLARYIEGGIDELLLRSLEGFFQSEGPENWREEVKPYVDRAKQGKLSRPAPTASDELIGHLAYYERVLGREKRSKIIDAQIAVFRHPREHYIKITANLLPILSMLTSGDLGRSLSPDPWDAEDHRPIMNLDKVIRGKHVFYVCLDSLPDPAVASALGAIVLADLAALAGMRYNLKIREPRISLFVDEIAEVINDPLIQILNKGVESRVWTTCSMQTLSDLAARLGSQAKARMALGNLNNLIALRSKDQETQNFIVETFGKTAIQNVEVRLSTHTDEHIAEFAGGFQRGLKESYEERVPPDLLGKLPNLQYFASVSGGRLVKGRVPILVPNAGP